MRCCSLLATAALADPKFPPLTGRIVDEAALLSADDRRALEAELKALEEKSTDQLVVYTTRSLQGYPIEDFGYRLGRAWAIGQKDKNNGVILIVAPTDRKVRIEVGRGLEPQLTDLMTKLIIENAILPAFRRNDFAGGIKAGVRDIRDVLLGDAEAVKERAKGGAKRSPGGGSNFPLLILVLFILIAVCDGVDAVAADRAPEPRSRRDRRRATAATSASLGQRRRQLGRLERRRAAARTAAAAASRAAAAISAAAARRAAGRVTAAQRRKVTRMTLVAEADQRRIADAITEAERTTSGEIVAVIAPESGQLPARPVPVGGAGGAGRALAVRVLDLVADPAHLRAAARRVRRARRRPHAAAGAAGAGAAIGQARQGAPPRRRAVPGAEPAHHRRPHGRADLRLRRRALRRDPGRRRHPRRRCRRAPGRRSCADLTEHIGKGQAGDGFVRAIAAVGEHLAQHFPPGAQAPHALSNHLIVLPPGMSERATACHACFLPGLGQRLATIGSTSSISRRVWRMTASPSATAGRSTNLDTPASMYSAMRVTIASASPMAK